VNKSCQVNCPSTSAIGLNHVPPPHPTNAASLAANCMFIIMQVEVYAHRLFLVVIGSSLYVSLRGTVSPYCARQFQYLVGVKPLTRAAL